VEAAKQEAVRLAQEWADMVDAKDVIVAFTAPNGFRKRILPTYKANRKGEKPAALGAAREAIESKFKSHSIPGLEADDILGILATTDQYREQAVIVTIDKDLASIPGRHFNPNKPTPIYTATESWADHWWMTQTLTGDSTDGYSGCPGIGLVKAARLLDPRLELHRLWPVVVKAFADKKLTEDDALVQARVARILRREDYCKETKRIRLWHPTAPVYIPLNG
jgi:DNA polymerase-1